MAEGGEQLPMYQVVNAQTVHFNQSQSVRVIGHNVRNINITESNVEEVRVMPVNNGQGLHQHEHEPAENVEADSATISSNHTVESATDTPGTTTTNRSLKRRPSFFEEVQSADPPTGSGWVKLSETISMNNLQPLKKDVTVYRGKQKFAGGWRDVVVKLLPYNEKDFSEVKFHLKLDDHPNILRMFDAGEINGVERRIYIVMELCSQTLKEFIDENKKATFDFEQRCSFAKQIVSGVAFIHKNQILHRDIKLENLLLSPSKESIRVADFGLSKQLKDGHSVASVTSRGLGSGGYQAPEILSENPKASFYSDTFSLGIVLAMLFSNGQHPFGSDRLRWSTNIMDNKSPNLSQIIKFEEPYSCKRSQLINLIKTCLKHNPRERPTPEEMLQLPFFSINADVARTDTEQNGFMTKWGSGLQSLISVTNNSSNGKGELKLPLKEIGYEKSSKILEELWISLGKDDLNILLQLAECHLQLMSDKKDSSIEKVAQFISTSGSLSASYVWKMADELYETNNFVQSMILYKISHDLHKTEKISDPHDELRRISNRVINIKSAVQPLAVEGGRSRDIAVHYGLKYMNVMSKDLKAVKNARPDVRALNELICLVNITSIYNDVGQYGKGILLGEAGITMMKTQFRENVLRYKDYGGLLNNLGNSYLRSGQYSNAQHCYVIAIEVDEKALDFENEIERRKYIEIAKRNFEIARQSIQKGNQHVATT